MKECVKRIYLTVEFRYSVNGVVSIAYVDLNPRPIYFFFCYGYEGEGYSTRAIRRSALIYENRIGGLRPFTRDNFLTGIELAVPRFIVRTVNDDFRDHPYVDANFSIIFDLARPYLTPLFHLNLFSIFPDGFSGFNSDRLRAIRANDRNRFHFLSNALVLLKVGTVEFNAGDNGFFKAYVSRFVGFDLRRLFTGVERKLILGRYALEIYGGGDFYYTFIRIGRFVASYHFADSRNNE